jgi:hypothetical protein
MKTSASLLPAVGIWQSFLQRTQKLSFVKTRPRSGRPFHFLFINYFDPFPGTTVHENVAAAPEPVAAVRNSR